MRAGFGKLSRRQFFGFDTWDWGVYTDIAKKKSGSGEFVLVTVPVAWCARYDLLRLCVTKPAPPFVIPASVSVSGPCGALCNYMATMCSTFGNSHAISRDCHHLPAMAMLAMLFGTSLKAYAVLPCLRRSYSDTVVQNLGSPSACRGLCKQEHGY